MRRCVICRMRRAVLSHGHEASQRGTCLARQETRNPGRATGTTTWDYLGITTEDTDYLGSSSIIGVGGSFMGGRWGGGSEGGGGEGWEGVGREGGRLG